MNRSMESQAPRGERIPMRPTTGPLASAFVALTAFPTFAADIEGAWATDSAYCSKVFVKTGNGVSFTTDADLYGGGFIVEGNRASGTFQKCKIESMKDDGSKIRPAPMGSWFRTASLP